MLNHITKSEGEIGRVRKKGEREKETLDSKKSNLLSLTGGLQWDFESSTQLIPIRPGPAAPGPLLLSY